MLGLNLISRDLLRDFMCLNDLYLYLFLSTYLSPTTIVWLFRTLLCNSCTYSKEFVPGTIKVIVYTFIKKSYTYTYFKCFYVYNI